MTTHLASRRPLAAAVAAAGAVAVALAAVAPAPARDGAHVLAADVAPYTAERPGVVTNSGVSGRASIVAPAGGRHVIVRIGAGGLQAGEEYGVHVHDGACSQYLGHLQYQSPGPVTRDNEVWLDLRANRDGRARDQVRVPRFDTRRALSIVIHARSNPDHAPGAPGHPGARIACGDFAPRS